MIYTLDVSNEVTQSIRTVVNGYSLNIEIRANSRLQKHYCNVRLANGTIILQNKPLSFNDPIFFNSASPFVGYITLGKLGNYTFPNLKDGGCFLYVVTQ